MKKFKYNPYFPYFHRIKTHLMGKRHLFKDPILFTIEDYLQYLDSLNENLERSERKAQMNRLQRLQRLLENQVSVANYRIFVQTGLLPFSSPDLLDVYFIHVIKSSGYPSTDKKYYPSFAEKLILTLEHLEFFFEVLADSYEELTKTWKMRDEIVTDEVAKECKEAALWLKEKLAAISAISSEDDVAALSTSENEAVRNWIDSVIECEGLGEEVFPEDYERNYGDDYEDYEDCDYRENRENREYSKYRTAVTAVTA